MNHELLEMPSRVETGNDECYHFYCNNQTDAVSYICVCVCVCVFTCVCLSCLLSALEFFSKDPKFSF
jgi:hypothetical protein